MIILSDRLVYGLQDCQISKLLLHILWFYNFPNIASGVVKLCKIVFFTVFKHLLFKFWPKNQHNECFILLIGLKTTRLVIIFLIAVLINFQQHLKNGPEMKKHVEISVFCIFRSDFLCSWEKSHCFSCWFSCTNSKWIQKV